MSKSEAIDQELNVLRAIFSQDELNEERTEKGLKLNFKINPDFHTDDGPMTSRRCCSLHLSLYIDEKYPNRVPEVEIKNPRGLMEDQLNILNLEIRSLLTSNIGQPILYDVIQLAQDFLARDDVTVPKLPCSICLSIFYDQQDLFITHECHHHFHLSCMARYLKHWCCERGAGLEFVQPLCPVCRCPITFPDSLDLSTTEISENDLPSTSFDWKEFSDPIERNFKDLYDKQRRQGGLIDLEEEQKRMLITDDTKIVRPNQSAALINVCDPEQGSFDPTTATSGKEDGKSTGSQAYRYGNNQHHHHHQRCHQKYSKPAKSFYSTTFNRRKNQGRLSLNCVRHTKDAPPDEDIDKSVEGTDK